MTRGSLGGGVARGTLRWSVVVLRNGARAFGEATRSSPRTPRSSFPCCRQNTDPFAHGLFSNRDFGFTQFRSFRFRAFFSRGEQFGNSAKNRDP